MDNQTPVQRGIIRNPRIFLDAPTHLIVTGFGRCGTTMVMTMLDAGGFPVAGPRPAYEVAAAMGVGRLDHDWMDWQTGRAVKVIDPTTCPLHRYPFRVPPVVICLQRDLTQQARSQIALATGRFDPPRHMVKAVARDLRRDTPPMRARLSGLAGHLYGETFEGALKNPYRFAALLEHIAQVHFNRPFDAAAATRVVLDRPITCMPDHRIEAALLPALAATLPERSDHD